jgi:D-alanyl-D-alanine carboxypeptidase (penicillin-binding protein 5/6)
MTNTVFKTPNGLPAAGQMTTARDMMKLSTAYLRRFPEALTIHSMKNFTHNRVTTYNRNRLLGSCEGVDGLKTGFVCAAGYNIVATAKRGKTRLVAVVLGAPSANIRAAETRKLIEAGFAMTRGETPVVTAEQDDQPRAAKVVKVSKKARKAKAVHKPSVAAVKPAKVVAVKAAAKAEHKVVEHKVEPKPEPKAEKDKKPVKQTAAEAKKAKPSRAAL